MMEMGKESQWNEAVRGGTCSLSQCSSAGSQPTSPVCGRVDVDFEEEELSKRRMKGSVVLGMVAFCVIALVS